MSRHRWSKFMMSESVTREKISSIIIDVIITAYRTPEIQPKCIILGPGKFLRSERCVCQIRVIHQVLQRYMSQSGDMIWPDLAGFGTQLGKTANIHIYTTSPKYSHDNTGVDVYWHHLCKAQYCWLCNQNLVVNSMHYWVPKILSITAISYVLVQIFKHFIGHQFSTISQIITLLEVKQFALLPAMAKLTCQDRFSEFP
jgi:hypothetical protein